MTANFRLLVFLGALTAVGVALLGWQRHATLDLRDQLAMRRLQSREGARLRAEHQRLIAARTTAADLDALLAERSAVAHLRTELERLRRRAGETTGVRPAAVPDATSPSLAGNVLVHSLWQNRGEATPAAAFETTLWAAMAGDLDRLAGLLALDPEARNEAEALFVQLPEPLRREFVSPERLVAALTAKDVPMGSATILGQYPTPAETQLTAQLFDAEGKQRIALFTLRPTGDRWQLVVPGNAVRRYATWLHRPTGADPAAN